MNSIIVLLAPTLNALMNVGQVFIGSIVLIGLVVVVIEVLRKFKRWE